MVKYLVWFTTEKHGKSFNGLIVKVGSNIGVFFVGRYNFNYTLT